MFTTILGYVVDGSVVDYSTYIVSVLMIPITLMWRNVRVLYRNCRITAGAPKEPYPLMENWKHAGHTFMYSISLVPCFYLILGCFSHEALQSLMDASKLTLALCGTLASFVTLQDIFK